jgi:hypothetical protein
MMVRLCRKHFQLILRSLSALMDMSQGGTIALLITEKSRIIQVI